MSEERKKDYEEAKKIVNDYYNKLKTEQFIAPYKAVIAIDFDGTIADTVYPDLGPLRDNADYYINKLYDEGYGIIINTCRSGSHEQLVIDYLRVNNIKYHYINENFPYLIELYGTDCRKISADVYIDDKCLYKIPDWKTKYEIIISKFESNE